MFRWVKPSRVCGPAGGGPTPGQIGSGTSPEETGTHVRKRALMACEMGGNRKPLSRVHSL
ncbi:hypothetical protein Sa4125_42890 [Aureimonas sp. SA4125]|nr:hypothetical protein Sa4125_42890 [Aureimonas sp. SA4125]